MTHEGVNIVKYEDVSPVFGVKESLVKSVIIRDDLVRCIKESRFDRKHIIIYGGSKQGKTTLFKQSFDETEYINIQCSEIDSIDKLYKMILNEAGVNHVETTTKEKSCSIDSNISISSDVKIPLVSKVEAEGEIGGNYGSSITTTFANGLADLSIPQNIIKLLKEAKFDKFIKLENFHYLSQKIQKVLAQDLRTFSENNVIFIILGVWTQQDSLFLKNLDLNGRMQDVTVEPWNQVDLKKIIAKGSKELGISIPDDIQIDIIKNSFGNVGLLQDICKYSAVNASENCDGEVIITKENLEYSLKRIQEGELTRTNQFFNLLLEVNNFSGKLYIPYFFCRSLLNFDAQQLSTGIDIRSIFQKIQEIRSLLNKDMRTYSSISLSDVTDYLTKITDKQKEAGFSTPLIDYNKSSIGSELSIIDKYFLFFLHRLSEEDFDKIVPNPIKNKETESKKDQTIMVDSENLVYIKKLITENNMLKDQLALKELNETVDSISNFDADDFPYEEPTAEELKQIEAENNK